MKDLFKYPGNDLPAGTVVFLVALPLCLGIALASGAPLFSGLIAGIVGGIVVGTASGSQLSVSGPAAGLTVIVFGAIAKLGTFDAFILAVAIAGVIQIILGYLRAGVIGHYFPSAVIKGMLSAIGLILILKQIPHALGDDRDWVGDDGFFQFNEENTFTEIIMAVQNVELSALIISSICLSILIFWEQGFMQKMKWTKIIPGPLVAVIAGVGINILYGSIWPEAQLKDIHMVQLPITGSFGAFAAELTLPDFSAILNPQVYVVAFTIAIVASLETLLSLDAVDKLDPYKRIAPQSRELKAQGLGNLISGLIGGLPLTAVIVRSSANVSSGARTKVSAIFHGLLLLLSVVFFPQIMNLIPLSALAAILLVVGYKLTKPSLYGIMYKKGLDQFLPFIITITAILFTDLLVGICIGMVVGIFFVIKTNFHEAIFFSQEGKNYLIRLNKDVSFLNKAELRRHMEAVEEGSHVVIDGTNAGFIDTDILETIKDFEKNADHNSITLELKGTTNG
ncbi:MAG: SulP family inorganic anion transporter [Cyclobacteriaceae bacterium]